MVAVGDRIKIIKAQKGAFGANGKSGLVIDKPYEEPSKFGGLHFDKCGVFVKLEDGCIWNIGEEIQYEILQKGEKSMQITVNETDMQIKDGKLIININSDLEKVLNSNKMVLSSVKVGDIINDKYIVLEHFADGTTAVIQKDLLNDVMEFGESNNDWRESNVRRYLNNDYLKEIEKEFGVDNIVEHTTNLFSMDGLNDYGTCRDKVGLLDIDQYRKYRKVLGKNMDSFWWLLTPDSTPSGWSALYVLCIGGHGDVSYYGRDYLGSVRPFYILKSSIFVSCGKTTA